MQTSFDWIFSKNLRPEPKHRVFIIAEIGVNFNGDIGLAKSMIEAAKECGADCVKFQTFTAETLVTGGTPKVPYQLDRHNPTESHYDMIQKLEFRREDHSPIIEFCRELNIEFLSTPYDVESAKFLSTLGVGMFKVCSADLIDLPLHRYLASTGKPVILSTGMATLAEIDEALMVYRECNHDKINLMHCVANYPCAAESLNMRALRLLHDAFDLPVGYSDHSIGPSAAILAVALGARVIEKHFTTDKSLPGPDQKASCDPVELRTLVKAVRDAEVMLGEPVKKCQDEERGMYEVSRKSLTLARDVRKGTVIQAADLTTKRPGTGIKPNQISAIVGRVATEDLAANSLLRYGDFK